MSHVRILKKKHVSAVNYVLLLNRNRYNAQIPNTEMKMRTKQQLPENCFNENDLVSSLNFFLNVYVRCVK